MGNIYADESLWRARLHGARPTEKLTRAQVVDLVAGVQDVLRQSLAQGGTSFDSLYVDVNGQSGYFSRSLAVYGQVDRPCPRCGTPIRRESFMNRSSYSCPTCQPRPRAARDAPSGPAGVTRRVVALVSGDVQGVGYRWFVRGRAGERGAGRVGDQPARRAGRGGARGSRRTTCTPSWTPWPDPDAPGAPRDVELTEQDPVGAEGFTTG